MGRIEKTVFISYRRANLAWALFIYQNLVMHGYDVFFDYQSIDSGDFAKVILDNIRARAHFIVILTPSALERCKESGDWLRREIETAIDERRNIIPLMVEGFDFGNPLVNEALTGKLALLRKFNGLLMPHGYELEALNRLRDRYLNQELSGLDLPALPAGVQKITDTQKIAANEAMPIQREQLSAQIWFERGFAYQVDKNLDEAIRCYSEALRCDPNLYMAQSNLGVLYSYMKRYAEAEISFRKAIDLNPIDAASHYNLGVLLKDLNRTIEAEAAFQKATALDSSITRKASFNLFALFRRIKRYLQGK